MQYTKEKKKSKKQALEKRVQEEMVDSTGETSYHGGSVGQAAGK